MSVVLFRRVMDDFKTAARVRGFQVGGGGGSSSSREHISAKDTGRRRQAAQDGIETALVASLGAPTASSYMHVSA